MKPEAPTGQEEVHPSPTEQLVNRLSFLIPDDEFVRMREEGQFSSIRKHLRGENEKDVDIEIQGMPLFHGRDKIVSNETEWIIRVGPRRFLARVDGEITGPVDLRTFSIKHGVVTAAGEETPLPHGGVMNLFLQISQPQEVRETWWQRGHPRQMPQVLIGGSPLDDYKRRHRYL